jgi:hypothetical protein
MKGPGCGYLAAGVHKPVGQVRKPYKKLTIDVIHAIDKLLESEWQNTRPSDKKKKIAEMGVWFIGGFCTGLRGEELLLIKSAGTANGLIHMDNVKNPHFIFVISGCTRQIICQEQSLEYHVLPSLRSLI